MARDEILLNLINDTGMNIKEFAVHASIPYTTLRSILDRGIGNSSVNNVIKICRALGITVEELENMAYKAKGIEIETIAAHHDGEKWSQDELQEIENFKQYVLSKRATK